MVEGPHDVYICADCVRVALKIANGMRSPKSCSFCGKSVDEAGPMIEGPDGILMCCACVDAANAIFVQKSQA